MAKKGKGKDKPAKSAAKDESGVATHRTEEEKKLAEECRRLKHSHEDERKLLNEFEQQVLKIESFWKMKKQDLEAAKMDLRNKMKQKQELQDKQEFELKIYQEKVKHLLHEHQSNITDVRIEAEEVIKTLETMHRDELYEKQRESRSLLVGQKQFAQKHGELMDEHKKAHQRQIYELRNEYEQKIDDMRLVYDEKMRDIRVKASEERKITKKKIENAKNAHISKLMQKHKEAFDDIRSYYSDITHANLDLIKSLKGEVQEMQKKEKSKEQSLAELVQKNKQLSEPLRQYLKEIEELKEEKIVYDKETKELKKTHSKISKLDEQIDGVTWKHEILQQKFKQASEEKEIIQKKLSKTVFDMQQRAGLQRLILSKKIQIASEDLEKQRIALHEILRSAKINPNVMQSASRSLDEIISAKDNTIKHLNSQYEYFRQKYYNAVHFYETAMRNHNIPIAELGFVPRSL